jgi:hypothetical protein
MEDQMTAPARTLRSTAEVATDRSDRWIKQLSAHLGRKAETRPVDGGQLLQIAGGSCRMTGDDHALRFDATAPDEASLERVQRVVGGHFERFAASEGLTVAWHREPGAAGPEVVAEVGPEPS